VKEVGDLMEKLRNGFIEPRISIWINLVVISIVLFYMREFYWVSIFLLSVINGVNILNQELYLKKVEKEGQYQMIKVNIKDLTFYSFIFGAVFFAIWNYNDPGFAAILVNMYIFQLYNSYLKHRTILFNR